METTNMEKMLKAPLFFEKNRVFRVYTGGALFADFFGDDSTDGNLPEEWVVSSVAAINRVSRGEKEGVSRVRGTDLFFDDLLRDYPRQLLGDRETFGVLTKVLDSAIRLPVQAHPDKPYSRKYLNSNYGKAESWVILATRPDACVYFGFKDKITKEEFTAAVEQSMTDKEVMGDLLNRIPVKTGDVYFVPARMVHAIGAGCLILEIQEPTDFTVQPEHWCGDYLLDDKEMYINLDHDIAMDVFDYSLHGEEAIAAGWRTPKLLSEKDGCRTEELISYEDTPCFAVHRYTLTDSTLTLFHKPCVYVVTAGEGEIECMGETKILKKGEYFFLPYGAEETVVKTAGTLEIVACLPPKTDK